MERKRRKQEDRMRRLEDKKRTVVCSNNNVCSTVKGGGVYSDDPSLGGVPDVEIDVVGDCTDEESTSARMTSSRYRFDVDSTSKRYLDEVHLSSTSPASSISDTSARRLSLGALSDDSVPPCGPDTKKSPFSIDSLLESPKVPRGRRPNSKYPRVQACKSMNPLSLGVFPLFPITQPMGFQVEHSSSLHVNNRMAPVVSPPKSPAIHRDIQIDLKDVPDRADMYNSKPRVTEIEQPQSAFEISPQKIVKDENIVKNHPEHFEGVSSDENAQTADVTRT